jgi:excisionase family DNA binding protein
MERLYTIDEIAQAGGPKRSKLYEEIREGRLEAAKFGRLTRITESAYRKYLASAPLIAPKADMKPAEPARRRRRRQRKV